MPPKAPCAVCGTPRYLGTGSLPQPICRDCRRKTLSYELRKYGMRRPLTCAHCRRTFTSYSPHAKYCTDRCRYKARGRRGTKPHYAGSYATDAKKIRDTAYANPATRCGRCGLTLAEHKPGDTWTAGHVVDGMVGGELRPEAKSCNSGAGAAMGNRLRRQRLTALSW